MKVSCRVKALADRRVHIGSLGLVYNAYSRLHENCYVANKEDLLYVRSLGQVFNTIMGLDQSAVRWTWARRLASWSAATPGRSSDTKAKFVCTSLKMSFLSIACVLLTVRKPHNLCIPWWATKIWDTESFVRARRFLHTPDYIDRMDCGALVPFLSPLVLMSFVFYARSDDGDKMTRRTKAI